MDANEMKSHIPLKAQRHWSKLEDSPVAFFCAEYAIPGMADTYAGGLGVLAMDFLLQAADDGFPFVALGIKYKMGKIPGFEQVVLTGEKTPLVVEVPVRNRTIKVSAWMRRFSESAVLLLLDTDLPENSPEDRALLEHIYDTHFYIRLAQQMILGIAGVRLLSALNIFPSMYHLNEGYTAFAALALIAEKAKKEGLSFEKSHEIMKSKIVATKHTILSEAGLYIRKGEILEFIGSYCAEQNIDPSAVFNLGMFELDNDTFSTTKFAIQSSLRQNGVSIIHTVFEKERHPHSLLSPITNGIYKKRWKASAWPEGISPSDMDDEDIWRTKGLLRKNLINFVKEKSGVSLDPDALTVVWARRFASYKRPDLLFSDITRLSRLAGNSDRPVQFIISGKAHKADEVGVRTIERIKMLSMDGALKGKVSYVPDYSVEESTVLVQGADVWLNTPLRGKEACGTSGMKAGLNGAIELSVSDGWVDEVDWEGKGWILPDEGTAEFIYDVLEGEILPEFYDRDGHGMPRSWVHRMRATMDIIESRYGAERMLRDYAQKMYGFSK